ncbi:Uncharacterised protein [Vibrio cholerae]|nr:Uncharacterised protein [Vibrio cholerae]
MMASVSAGSLFAPLMALNCELSAQYLDSYVAPLSVRFVLPQLNVPRESAVQIS